MVLIGRSLLARVHLGVGCWAPEVFVDLFIYLKPQARISSQTCESLILLNGVKPPLEIKRLNSFQGELVTCLLLPSFPLRELGPCRRREQGRSKQTAELLPPFSQTDPKPIITEKRKAFLEMNDEQEGHIINVWLSSRQQRCSCGTS